jgi:glycosyltransferase involved in cell wall biosynthesis
MRITFVLPPFDLTGGQRAVAAHAEHLRRRGHDVVAVAPPHRRPGPMQVLKAVLRGRGRGLPALSKYHPSHFDNTGVERRVLDGYRPVAASDVPDADVVVATWWETAEWVAALPDRKGAKVHYMMDYEVFGGPKDRVDATCRLPMPKILIAEWVARLLRDRFDFHDVTVVPCGVDTDLFHAPPRGKQPRPTVGLVYSSLIDYATGINNKGTDISLQAVEVARRHLPDLRLVAFGNCRPTQDLPLPAGCEFNYRVPDHQLREIYSRCDAWLFGTRVEGFGLPILEAMACRTPVIGTPAGAAPELLSEGGGVLVPPEDPEAMARAILDVAGADEARWKSVSDAALATASRHTWAAATDRYEEALVRAVERFKALPARW